MMKRRFAHKFVSLLTLCVFVLNTALVSSWAQGIPIKSIPSSFGQFDPKVPPLLKGVIVNHDSPFNFDFILDTGIKNFPQSKIEEVSELLIQYFLTCLSMPAEELWVNLSPYEKDRIIPGILSKTALGRDLLMQDSLLKDLSASLTNPNSAEGKIYWDKIRAVVGNVNASSDHPVNVFNKVWIVPDTAKILEKGDRAYIVHTHLKVLTEQDYLAISKNVVKDSSAPDKYSSHFYSDVIRETIIPQIENEINNGERFAPLRQIYHSFVLAIWFKNQLRKSVWSEKYFNQNKIEGIEVDNKTKEIYRKYLTGFQRGSYEVIKEEYDPQSQSIIPQHYFSGGAKLLQDVPYETNRSVAGNSEEELSPMGDLVNVTGRFRTSDVTVTPIDDVDLYAWGFPNTFMSVPDSYWNGKTIFVRPDYNVKIDKKNGVVTENSRIAKTVPMLVQAIKAGARLVLSSHFEDPQDEMKKRLEKKELKAKRSSDAGNSDALQEFENSKESIKLRIQEKVLSEYSLAPVAIELERLVNQELKKIGHKSVTVYFNKDHRTAVQAQGIVDYLMNPGDILLLENSRFDKREAVLHKAKEGFEKKIKKILKEKKELLVQSLGEENSVRIQKIVDGIINNYQLDEIYLKQARQILIQILKDPAVGLKLSMEFVNSPVETVMNTYVEFLDNLTEDWKTKNGELLEFLFLIDKSIQELYKPLKEHLAYQAELMYSADAFVLEGASVMHRGHASTLAPAHLPSFVGPLVAFELNYLKISIENVELAAIGGKNIKSLREKLIELTPGLLRAPKMKKLITGGQVGLTFLKALDKPAVRNIKLKIPESENDSTYIEYARGLLSDPTYAGMIEIPLDLVVGKNYVIKNEESDDSDDSDEVKIKDDPTKIEVKVISVDDPLEEGWIFIDIGPKTINKYAELIQKSPYSFINGPMGANKRDNDSLFAIIEDEDDRELKLGRRGSRMIAESFAKAVKNGATDVGGGGGTSETIERYYLTDELSYVLTGGGSSLRRLGGYQLPAYEALIQDSVPQTFMDFDRIRNMISKGSIISKGMYAVIVHRGLVSMFEDLEELMREFDKITNINLTDNKLKNIEAYQRELIRLKDPIPPGKSRFKKGDEKVAQKFYDDVKRILLGADKDFQVDFRKASLRDTTIVKRLENNPKMLTKVQDVVDQISWIRHNIWNLYNQLRDIESTDEEKDPILNFNVDLKDLIPRIVNDLKAEDLEDASIPEILSKGLVEIKINLDPNTPLIVTQKGRLIANLKGLIRNAIRASVAVNERDEFLPFNKVGNKRDRNQRNIITISSTYDFAEGVKLDISDNGVGMSPEILANARKYYYSKNIQLTDDDKLYKVLFGQSTGTGIPAFELFLNEMGGRLDIKSDQQTGTTVTAYFPNFVKAVSPNFQKIPLVRAALHPPSNGNGHKNGYSSDDKKTDDRSVGGIDFNSDFLKINNNGEEFDWDEIYGNDKFKFINVPGLVPVIENYQPVNNLPQLLGIKEPQEDAVTLSALK